jgi:release factor glutamine methyltransferase
MTSPATPHLTEKSGLKRRPPQQTVAETVDRSSLFLKERGIPSFRLDARLIAAFVLGRSDVDVTLMSDRPVTKREAERIEALVRRRAAGVPTAYLVGKKEFWSLALSVDERVLVPRPETELLVSETISAASLLRKDDPRILEIGTGSGAVSLALAAELPRAVIVSTDISTGALTIAAANVAAHGMEGQIDLRRGNLYDALLPGESFDVIVSNPPYLTARELSEGPPEIRYEPRRALLGGADGLSVIRRLVAGAPVHLAPGGRLIIEIGAGQGEAVSALMEGTPGLAFSHVSNDLAALARAAVAVRTLSGGDTCSRR